MTNDRQATDKRPAPPASRPWGCQMTKQQLKLIREASSKKRDSAEDFRNRMEQWLDLKMNPFVRALIKGKVTHFIGFKFIRAQRMSGTTLKKLKRVQMLLDANEP